MPNQDATYPKRRQYVTRIVACWYDEAVISTTRFASPSMPETNWHVLCIIPKRDMPSYRAAASLLLASSVARPMKKSRRHNKPKSRTWSRRVQFSSQSI